MLIKCYLLLRMDLKNRKMEVSNMPLWGWIVLLVILSAIMIPIKLRILKIIMGKKNNTVEDEDE